MKRRVAWFLGLVHRQLSSEFFHHEHTQIIKQKKGMCSAGDRTNDHHQAASLRIAGHQRET
jgi:hypothetical protein